MSWLDAAVAWKMQYLRDERRWVAREIYEVAQHPEDAWKIPDLAKKLQQFGREMRDVTGADVGKAWDVSKRNLEKAIRNQKRLLTGMTDGDARLATEREIAALQGLLAGLVAEGRP